MKEWIKYSISIMIFVIFLNFWLIFQIQYSQTTISAILITGPTIISFVFVFRMLKLKKIYYRLGVDTLIVATVTLLNIYFRIEIDHMIDSFVSKDGETGIFIFLLLYLAENILLTYMVNFFHDRLKYKMNIANKT